MTGKSNHRYLSDSLFLDQACISDYTLFDLGYYPGIRPKAGGLVRGELYEVSPSAFQRICRKEGDGYLFQSTDVTAVSSGGSKIHAKCFVYLKHCENELTAQPNGLYWRAVR